MGSLVLYVHLTLFRFGLWLTGGVQVKFIKFFAWEEPLMGRLLHAREAEMKWMIKGAASSMECAYHTIVTDHVLSPARVNFILFYLL